MEGGELFDRIQRKGHFTERGEIHTNEHVHCTVFVTIVGGFKYVVYIIYCSMCYKIHISVVYITEVCPF